MEESEMASMDGAEIARLADLKDLPKGFMEVSTPTGTSETEEEEEEDDDFPPVRMPSDDEADEAPDLCPICLVRAANDPVGLCDNCELSQSPEQEVVVDEERSTPPARKRRKIDKVVVLEEEKPVTITGKLKAAKDEKADDDAPDCMKCCICYYNKRSIGHIPCGHGGCAGCTLKWYNDSRDDKEGFPCPQCKEHVSDVLVLY